jgi:glutamate 5-kinase
MVSADCLVLLSDVDGLYTADPTSDPAATYIPEVVRITPEIEAMAGGSASDVGSGGMATKVLAARIAVGAGCNMSITAGREQHPLRRIEAGERCTWFVAEASPMDVCASNGSPGCCRPRARFTSMTGRRKHSVPARACCRRGRAIEGRFDRGDAVVVRDDAGSRSRAA